MSQNRTNNKGTLPSKDQIGHYAIKRPELEEGNPVNMLSIAGDSDEALANEAAKMLGEEGCAALYDGVSHEPSRVAREKFLEILQQVLEDEEKDYRGDTGNPEKDAIAIEKLLGSDGLKAYKAAIEEERNSREYRTAVFLRSTKKYPGPTWKERLYLWIGGPSASGKSYGADLIIRKITDDNILDNDPSNRDGNFIVAIDGGVEREVSQMRKLVLQVALKKGYPGILDLHDNTKLNAKKHVEQAALTAKMNIVVPETFSIPWTKRNVGKHDAKDCKEIFAEVIGRPGHDEDFRQGVARMGNGRAWLMKYGMNNVSDDPIDINSYSLPCESKQYQGQYFKNGLEGSATARKYYQNLFANKHSNIYISLQNSLIFVREDKTNNKWVQCTADYRGEAVKIPAEDFQKWESAVAKDPSLNLKAWMKQRSLTPGTIQIKYGQHSKQKMLINELNELGVTLDFLHEDVRILFKSALSPQNNTNERKERLRHIFDRRYDEYAKLLIFITQELSRLTNTPLDPESVAVVANMQHSIRTIHAALNATGEWLDKDWLPLPNIVPTNNFTETRQLLFDINKLLAKLSYLPAKEEFERILNNQIIVDIRLNNPISFTPEKKEELGSLCAQLKEYAISLQSFFSLDDDYNNDHPTLENILEILSKLEPTIQTLTPIIADQSTISSDNEYASAIEDDSTPTSSNDEDANLVISPPPARPATVPAIIPMRDDPLGFHEFIRAVMAKQEQGHPCLEEVQACFSKDNRSFIFKNMNRINQFKQIYDQSTILMSKAIIEYDKKSFLGINMDEFYGNKGEQFKNAERSPTIAPVAPGFNRLSNFVKLNVFSSTDTKDIAFAINYWINVAYECAFNPNLKDLQGANAIVAALNNSAIAPILKAYQDQLLIPETSRARFEQLNNLFDPARNNKNQKEMLANHPNAIPYIGLMLSTREFTKQPELLHRETESLRARQADILRSPISAPGTPVLNLTAGNNPVTADSNLVDASIYDIFHKIAPKDSSGKRVFPSHTKLAKQLLLISPDNADAITPPASAPLFAASPSERKYPPFQYHLPANNAYVNKIYHLLIEGRYQVTEQDNLPGVINLDSAVHQLMKLNIADSTHSLLNIPPYVRCLALAHYIVVNKLASPNKAEKWLALFLKELTPEETETYKNFIASIPEFDRKFNADFDPVPYRNFLKVKAKERYESDLNLVMSDDEYNVLINHIDTLTKAQPLEMIEAYLDTDAAAHQQITDDLGMLLPYLSSEEQQEIANAKSIFNLEPQIDIHVKYRNNLPALIMAQEKASDIDSDSFKRLCHAILHAKDSRALAALGPYINLTTEEREKLEADVHRLQESSLPVEDRASLKQAYDHFDLTTLNSLREKYAYRLNAPDLTQQYREENVDIYQYPEQKQPPHNKDDTLTIGDLHASGMKFIYFLAKHDIIDITREDYAKLAAIYQRHLAYYEIYNVSALYAKEISVLSKNIKHYTNLLNQNVKKLADDHGIEFSIIGLSNRNFRENLDNEITTISSQIVELRNELHTLKSNNPASNQQQIAIIEKKISERVATRAIYTSFQNLLQDEKQLYEADANKKANDALLNAPDQKQAIKADIQAFDAILAKVKVVNPTNIRLIGDELSDRGANDYFVLEILRKLDSGHCRTEIMLSNHSVAFLDAHERNNSREIEMLGHQQANSSYMLQKAVTDGSITQNAVNRAINENYKPKLKIVSYSLNADRSGINLYSHAPIDIAVIQAMANKLGIAYNDTSPALLAYTIDMINEKFQEYVSRGEAHKLYTIGDPNSDPAEKLNNPFNFAMWNRNYAMLDRPDYHPQHHYAISYTHGHDPVGVNNRYIHNLDNSLAKVVVSGGRGAATTNHSGTYTMTHTTGTPLTLEERKACDKLISPVNIERLEASVTIFHQQAQTILAQQPTNPELELLATTQASLRQRIAKLEYQENGPTEKSAALSQLVDIEIRKPVIAPPEKSLLSDLKNLNGTLVDINLILDKLLASLTTKVDLTTPSLGDWGIFHVEDKAGPNIPPAPGLNPGNKVGKVK